MYIMADLSSSGLAGQNTERVLCCIKIDANGSLVMKPDFGRSSYLIHTYGSSRETYEYFLEHVSSGISAENLVREMRLHKELYLRHSEYIKNLVGSAFKMVAVGSAPFVFVVLSFSFWGFEGLRFRGFEVLRF